MSTEPSTAAVEDPALAPLEELAPTPAPTEEEEEEPVAELEEEPPAAEPEEEPPS
jgi:hypothetical protein